MCEFFPLEISSLQSRLLRLTDTGDLHLASLHSLTPSDVWGGRFQMKSASHLLSPASRKNIAKSNFCPTPAAAHSLHFVHPARERFRFIL